MSRLLSSSLTRAVVAPLRPIVANTIRAAPAVAARSFGAHHVPVGPGSNIDGVYRRPEVAAPSAPLSEHDELMWDDAQAPEPTFDQWEDYDRWDALGQITAATRTRLSPILSSALPMDSHFLCCFCSVPSFVLYLFSCSGKLVGALVFVFAGVGGAVWLWGPKPTEVPCNSNQTHEMRAAWRQITTNDAITMCKYRRRRLICLFE